MNKKFFWLILCLPVIGSVFVVCSQNTGQAQIMAPKGISMFGTIEKGGVMSGYFGRNRTDSENKNWGVFIGSNGNVYKVSLIDKTVREFYINGQKIPFAEVSKHTAEYESFLKRFLRSEEIENESREFERQIKPLDRKIEAVSKEVEKLDRAEEKFDRDADKKSSSFAENRANSNAQQEKLSAIQNDLDKQVEDLSKQQEKLSKEQESLGLLTDLNNVLLSIGADLKSQGVIKNSNNLSFKLSNSEMIVNGKKVSPEVFESFKNKYIIEISGESGFIFNWKGEI